MLSFDPFFLNSRFDILRIDKYNISNLEISEYVYYDINNVYSNSL